MALDISPGVDGFTTNFYKCFWNELKQPLLDSFLYSFKSGELVGGQRRGLLNLIPKKGKDLRFLKSWRPVSLLSTFTPARIFVNRILATFRNILLKKELSCRRNFFRISTGFLHFFFLSMALLRSLRTPFLTTINCSSMLALKVWVASGYMLLHYSFSGLPPLHYPPGNVKPFGGPTSLGQSLGTIFSIHILW